MRKATLFLLVLLPLLCLTILAVSLMDNSKKALQLEGVATEYPESGFGMGYYPGGGQPPAGGTCDNVGQDYSDDLFRGWPVDFFPGNWNIVSTWYCDPHYFPGHTHWGIDLARLDWDAGHAIDDAPVVTTTEHAVVRQAVWCPPEKPCWNFGMGNFVQIEALKPETQCLVDPQTRELKCKDIWIPSGWKATFMHLHDIAVHPGESLDKGQLLGHVDNSGNSTGPHLHYQINNPSGKPVDPAPTMTDDYTTLLRTKWKGTR